MSEEQRELNLSGRMIPMKGGKEYLPVADRIVWFRRDSPEGTIETTLVEHDRAEGYACFRARVTTGQGGVAEATGSETRRDFGDYLEKAETKAIGRALGFLGYGTAAAGFEEGARVVDTPRPKPPQASPAAPGGAEAPNEGEYTWAHLKRDLRAYGITGRGPLEEYLGASTDGWAPADILTAVKDRARETGGTR